jgi:pyrimidine operon attenuation protein/uracil phosphoribosyltransferase
MEDIMKLKALIMDGEKVSRTITRLAHEIIENCNDLDNLVFVGIRTRGVPLAQKIVDCIAEYTGVKLPVGILDITLYRDDLSLICDHPVINSTEIPFNIFGKCIILVDDVLFTGRTVRAAIEALMQISRPQSIKLLVLVDRGHRELPFRADFIGKNLPTSITENVKVRFVETDGIQNVELYEMKE